MNKIPSFTIDHEKLLRGVYVSRQDNVGGEVVTTFDIRMKEPNREPALGQGAIHTIDCLTGCYLLLRGDLASADILPLLRETFRFVAEYEGEVPGAAARDCGNYLLHDLPMARWEAAKYLHEVLEQATEANLQYPA